MGPPVQLRVLVTGIRVKDARPYFLQLQVRAHPPPRGPSIVALRKVILGTPNHDDPLPFPPSPSTRLCARATRNHIP